MLPCSTWMMWSLNLLLALPQVRLSALFLSGMPVQLTVACSPLQRLSTMQSSPAVGSGLFSVLCTLRLATVLIASQCPLKVHLRRKAAFTGAMLVSARGCCAVRQKLCPAALTWAFWELTPPPAAACLCPQTGC